MRCLVAMLCCALVPVVAEAQTAPAPVLRTELETDAAIPGQPIVLRVTVLVPTWLPDPPVFPTFEVPDVMVRLPARASGPTSQRIGGETWSGVTRAYRITPMTPGDFEIPPQTVTVTYADAKTREPVSADLTTEPVRFRGAAPDGAEDLDPFIAADALEIEQTIDGDTGDLEPGDAFTRRVTVRVEGTSPIFVPPLIAPLDAAGLSSYPDEPVVTEAEERGRLSGSRVESVTYVAEAGGRHTAPPISLRWFNLDAGAVETVEVDGFGIAVRGPVVEPREPVEWRTLVVWIAGIVLLLGLSVAVAWRLWPRVTAWRSTRRAVVLASEAHAFRQVLAAIRGRDLGRTMHEIEHWSMRLPATLAPEEAKLTSALTALGSARYGRGTPSASGEAWHSLERALQAVRRARLAARSLERTGRSLPPLNPQPVT